MTRLNRRELLALAGVGLAARIGTAADAEKPLFEEVPAKVSGLSLGA